MTRLGRPLGATAVLLLLLLLGSIAPFIAPAGAGGQAQLAVESVDVSAFPEVRLTVSVPAAMAGADLRPASFALEENGVERDVSVSRLGSDELDVVVLMDTSGSMQGRPIVAAKASALSFVDRLPSGTNVAVVGFGDAPNVASPFTTDRSQTALAIDSLVARGETALYDALGAAATQLAAGTGSTRAVVLLSDGGDTVSATPLDQAIDAVSATGASFTAIELTTGESNRAALDQMALATGGSVVAVEDPNVLDQVYGSIATRLSNLYELRFESSGARRADLRIAVEQDGNRAEVLKAVDFPAAPAGTTSTTAIVIQPAKAFVTEAGGLSGSWLLALGAGLLALGLIGGLVVALVGNEPQRRLAREYEDAGVDEAAVAWLRSTADRTTSYMTQLLERRGQARSVDRSLDAAGLSVRAGEFVAFVAVSSVAAALVGYLLLGALGLLVGLVPAAVVPLVLSALRSRRQQQFADQLGEALLLLAGSLRAGFGLVHSVDSVARESDPPMSEEFSRVVVEMRLGRGLPEAMQAAANRVDSEDFRWVVDAIEIHQEVGGDLAQVLDRVGDTIRARVRARRQVRALSAEGRMSAAVLLALPFGVGAILAGSNPEYIGELFSATAGQIMLAVAGVLLVLGGLWLRRIIRPEF